MKTLFFTIAIVSTFSASTLKAQNKATQDDSHFITVAQSQTTKGRNNQTHYILTNVNSVSMDFSLCKQTSNGSWDVVHHLDLKPGQTYEDVNGFTAYSGKYVVYSAPHSDYATFPNSTQIAALQAGNTSAPAAPATQPATSTPTATTPVATSAPPANTTPATAPATTTKPKDW
ncbi:MAG TPA: hypothetical protein VK668_10575 [Mucilaginibacter sp.]|nr:hypothetical protein [Mucilaginibacter sp.]